jgi:D-arabinitol dehydrogenase (NADP+)
VSISPYDIYRREITIRGSFAQVHSFRAAVRSIVHERVRSEGIITHRFSLDDFGEAIESVRSDPTCLKAVVDPRL